MMKFRVKIKGKKRLLLDLFGGALMVAALVSMLQVKPQTWMEYLLDGFFLLSVACWTMVIVLEAKHGNYR